MRFAADKTVGKLAQWLRLMGYDTVDSSTISRETATTFANENRVLLTKAAHLSQKLKSVKITIVRLTPNDPKDQVRELIKKLRLIPNKKKFLTRCKLCNTILTTIPSEEVIGRVPDYVLERYDRFSKCITCGRVYWPGTHYEKIEKTLHMFFDKETS